MIELSEKDFDRIEAYLLGRMSDAEREAFEAELENNKALKEAVDRERDLIDAVAVEGLNRDLDRIHDELYAAEEKKSRKSLFISIAASVAVIIGFSLWYLGGDNLSDAETLAFNYTEPGLPVPMSASDSYDFYDAMVDYKSEEYDVAISKWEKLLETEPSNDTLLYFIGASHFNLKSYDKAEEYLTAVSESQESAFAYKAEYMIFLSAFQQGKQDFINDFEPSSGSPFTDQINEAKSYLD
jgi:tetratricopeptide (TPR) repeat protein